jgi:hypothetical protein
MARNRKTNALASDGLAQVQIWPFPALNPWNWWALTAPRNTVLASMHGARATLDACRNGADGIRALVRAQQDVWLAMLETSIDVTRERAASAAQAVETDPRSQDARLVAPIVEATRAYGRVGSAFIAAQRDTLRAFIRPETRSGDGAETKPH